MKNLVVTTYLSNREGNPLLFRCCASLQRQAVEDLIHIVIVDDYQDGDKTPESNNEEWFQRMVIFRQGRHGAMANVFYALTLNEYNSETLVSIVDGDDQLKPYCLKNINSIYKANSNILISSGGYVCESKKPARFDRGWNGYDLRRNPWSASHLRSFKHKLFKQVPEEYFKRDGEYFKTCSDLALMWPMMELAGPDRYKHIEIPTYIYNDLNPNNDHKINRDQQKSDEEYIRGMYPFKRLEKI